MGLIFSVGPIANSAFANIILTFGSASFFENSGVQTIDIFARSDSSDSALGVVAQFQLAAGKFPVIAGTFNQDGFIGFGNIVGG